MFSPIPTTVTLKQCRLRFLWNVFTNPYNLHGGKKTPGREIIVWLIIMIERLLIWGKTVLLIWEKLCCLFGKNYAVKLRKTVLLIWEYLCCLFGKNYAVNLGKTVMLIWGKTMLLI
jgi:hypothetical protein